MQAFNQANSTIANDELVVAAVRERLIREQIDDLRRVGVDIDKVEADLGRKLNHNEIAQAHLQWRAAGHDVRQVPELLETATDVVAQRFGLQRHGNDPDANRSAAVLARKNAYRVKRGLPALDQDRLSTDSDEHIPTSTSPADYTNAMMGWLPEGETAAQPVINPQASNRSSAIQEIQDRRWSAQGRNAKLRAGE